jgi:hypothetical protein
MKRYKNRFEWHEAMNTSITSALGKCYPRNWKDEDHLTRSVLEALVEEYEGVELSKDKIVADSTKCLWDVYKNTKQHGLEQKHGDIGVLVQLHFSKDTVLEGVAFLEAKRIYHDPFNSAKSEFKALDFDQLERVCGNSTCHRTLLYDCVVEDKVKYAYALTIPTRHFIALGEKSRDVYDFCEHFSYCLINRYFQGYELDFDPQKVAAAKGFLDANGGVDYLIVAQTAMRPGLDFNPILLNDNVYEVLETDDPDPGPGSSMSP